MEDMEERKKERVSTRERYKFKGSGRFTVA